MIPNNTRNKEINSDENQKNRVNWELQAVTDSNQRNQFYRINKSLEKEKAILKKSSNHKKPIKLVRRSITTHKIRIDNIGQFPLPSFEHVHGALARLHDHLANNLCHLFMRSLGFPLQQRNHRGAVLHKLGFRHLKTCGNNQKVDKLLLDHEKMLKN